MCLRKTPLSNLYVRTSHILNYKISAYASINSLMGTIWGNPWLLHLAKVGRKKPTIPSWCSESSRD